MSVNKKCKSWRSLFIVRYSNFNKVNINNFIEQFPLSNNNFSQTFGINNISEVHLVLYKLHWSCFFVPWNETDKRHWAKHSLYKNTQISLLTLLHCAWSLPSCMNGISPWIYALPLANVCSAQSKKTGHSVMVSFLAAERIMPFFWLTSFCIAFVVPDFCCPLSCLFPLPGSYLFHRCRFLF